MKDAFSREIEYLRISVTDRCNLRCKYCMPEEGIENIGHRQILSFEDIENIVLAAVKLGLKKFRITGGEPLVRKGILELVESLARIPGVLDLAMTTNGIRLEELAEPLKKAGLNRINVSIDSLREDRYFDITRGGDIERVKRGIRAAEQANLAPIRLNVVVMRGFNDDEIEDFAKLTMENPYDVRFIELMPIGSTGGRSSYITTKEIRLRLKNFIPVGESEGVAEYFQYPGAVGRVGLISPISSHFCDTCNKIRLTADGKIKTCLHSNQEIDLNDILKSKNPDLIFETLKRAIRSKEEKHQINENVLPIKRSMNKIGG